MPIGIGVHDRYFTMTLTLTLDVASVPEVELAVTVKL
jgi:hypothetical protein